VSCHGGASAWLYVQGYGNVDDLSEEAYGADGNLSGKVVAVWARAANQGGGLKGMK